MVLLTTWNVQIQIQLDMSSHTIVRLLDICHSFQILVIVCNLHSTILQKANRPIPEKLRVIGILDCDNRIVSNRQYLETHEIVLIR